MTKATLQHILATAIFMISIEFIIASTSDLPERQAQVVKVANYAVGQDGNILQGN